MNINLMFSGLSFFTTTFEDLVVAEMCNGLQTLFVLDCSSINASLGLLVDDPCIFNNDSPSPSSIVTHASCRLTSGRDSQSSTSCSAGDKPSRPYNLILLLRR